MFRHPFGLIAGDALFAVLQARKVYFRYRQNPWRYVAKQTDIEFAPVDIVLDQNRLFVLVQKAGHPSL
ncbi:hypothetical protein A2V82_07595 [candidate division KSB1 bacterium RBG_16_48_16]|nr:MAG: hypothetical protein A2V82_07595 [candidate division KSB1 bacterium RBG_16_48_16]